MVKKTPQKKTSKSFLKWLKSLLILFCSLFGIAGIVFLIINATTPADYIVNTNAFFAPFEYYDGPDIAGVDVDIMNRVAKKMGKTIEIKNVDFSVIIDNVASGKLADAGAAGITITDARQEKVDFSIPYYTSVQYVIFDPSSAPSNNGSYIIWEALTDKTLGAQIDTTGYLFADGEINDSGVLENTSTTLKGFESAQLAADGVAAHLVDAVIVDELPAKYIVSKNSNLTCLPLYYSGINGEPDSPAEESYAIAVNKNHPELLKAINETLEELISSGEINQLILKHMGL